mmetsp:Transcript_11194/g.16785  ORF Transcript_11194/g.16785 Transcript_11194/m.16785 type:complete len:181 (+) Transcript_11194:1101-1643(+)
MLNMTSPVVKATTAGTMEEYLHAISASSDAALKIGNNTDPITSWVTPPPKLPQPPTRAFAVPTISLVNIRDVQYWHMTKHEPAVPMNKRRTVRPTDEFTRNVSAVGIEAAHRTIAIIKRAPYLSHNGPREKRITTVPATLKMLDIHIWLLVSSRVFFISGNSGGMANQMKKAMKKLHQEQ